MDKIPDQGKKAIFEKLSKIALKKNEKTPAFKGWNNTVNQFENINSNYYNVGVVTGIINNIIVLDVDFKDNGNEEFKKYIDEYGEPKTVKQTTPNNGYHYFFKNTHSNPKYKYLIDNYLKNKSKYRDKGLDIRTNGGYVATEPSIIDGKPYKFIRSFDNCELLEMPEALIDWLLIAEKEIKQNRKKPIMKKETDNIIFTTTDEQIEKLLYKLPSIYYDNYNEWLYILTIFKNINKWAIFDKWSKQSKTYNVDKNIKLWNSNKGAIDINYLVYLVNIENKINIPLVSSYKPYTPITTNIINIKKIKMNNVYVFDENYNNEQLTKKIFDEYSTVIIESTTGTGKTTAIAEHLKASTNKIISIIPRISLANQHKDTFKKKNILLLSYLDDNNEKELNVYADNTVICINSLLKLQNLPLDIIKNSIIFIDEVASFIESLTDNETLNKHLKKINSLLMKLIKYAYKVVVSDAIINDGVFELLKHRPDDKKILIQNEFIKFKNIDAVRIKDENLFLNMIKAKIINNEPFLFPCDSCKTITKFYIDCLNISPDEFKNKFMLITADTKIKINDASKELKDKFVFYSPSITYGVDFQTNEPQDVFNYIKGESIQPSGFFQQTTRTRNINKLYYYCEEHNEQHFFNNLEEVKEHYRDIINISNTNLNNICVTVNENDEEILNENTFFNLFCYNEYVKDTYETNKLKHFEQLLLKNGFIYLN